MLKQVFACCCVACRPSTFSKTARRRQQCCSGFHITPKDLSHSTTQQSTMAIDHFLYSRRESARSWKANVWLKDATYCWQISLLDIHFRKKGSCEPAFNSRQPLLSEALGKNKSRFLCSFPPYFFLAKVSKIHSTDVPEHFWMLGWQWLQEWTL